MPLRIRQRRLRRSQAQRSRGIPVTDLYDLADAVVNGGTVERAEGMMVSPIKRRDPELGGGREYEGHLSCGRVLPVADGGGHD